MLGMLKSIRHKRMNSNIVHSNATTNAEGWSMQDVWNWGNEAKEFVESNQPKQRIKYGDNIVMLSKKEPIDMVFASEIM